MIERPDERKELPELRIYFERTGGFMGRDVTSLVDTSQLPDQEAHSLKTMVAEASFFELPPIVKLPTLGADQFQYKLVVEDATHRHSVETTEMAAPEALRPLLNRLTVLARSYPILPEDKSVFELASDNDLTSLEEE